MGWWNRARAYVAEVWFEVRPREGKVTWPTWPEVKGSTIVVLGALAITIAFLLVVDSGIAFVVKSLFGGG